MKTVLLICTGNLCRSPMAEVLLRARFAEMGLADQIFTESAGIHAREGQRASAPAVALMAERGLSLEEHRSRPVTVPMMEQAAMVIVMEETQRQFLFHLSMKNLHKVFLLTELSGGHEDIPDPYGGTRQMYVATVDLLVKLIDAGMPRLLKRLKVELPAGREMPPSGT